MFVYRSIFISCLAVLAAVALVVGCNSNPSAANRSEGRLEQEGEWSNGEDICNDNSDVVDGEQNVCENDERQQCGQHRNNACVSLCRDIQPIFDRRCTSCHNPTTLRGGLDLTRGNAYANLVNQPTSNACMASVPDSVRVVPCRPDASMLWLKTKPADPDSRCGVPMPLGSPGLGVIAPDEFAVIERWIAQGAQNN